MKEKFIEVFEKNNGSKEGNNQFSIEVSEKNQKNFLNSIKDERGTYFKIIGNFESEKKGFKRFHLKTTNYIGIFVFPDNPPIIIKPKISNSEFFQMLEFASFDNYYIFNQILHGISENKNFLKVIIMMFLRELNDFLKKSIRKLYKEEVQERKNIKGKILIKESLKSMGILSGKLVCEFETFTKDSLHNQIIKYTLHILMFIAPDDLIPQIKFCLSRFHNVSLIKNNLILFKKIKYDRFTNNYRIIHNFCRMIIENYSFGTTSGGAQCYSLLFYSSSIFEIFVRKVIKKSLDSKNYKVEKYSDPKIQPDIVIKRDSKIILLCDAKYKFQYNRAIDYRENQNLKKFLKKDYEDISNNLFLIESGKNEKYFAYLIDLSKISDQEYLHSWVNYLKNRFMKI
ncbi:MAG: hypothetical protein P8Y97_20205 [Candidatus Lokiarchaeota archaeon]